ncbi:MAG: T9SS type A sorting domain-containing protein [candidate division Zixibacteria bacterium]|nr:T9SS type A sorting domain-containing protein [candidate division Zixibacteria bacterium]
MRSIFFMAVFIAMSTISVYGALNEEAPGFVPSTEILDEGEILFGPIDVGSVTGDDKLLGCEFDGSYYWITGANSESDPNKLYKFDADWNLISVTDQPSHSTEWGWRDLVWDGVYLYASVDSSLDEIDPATGAWTGNTIPGPEFPNRALAYDPDTDHFWSANFTSNIYEFDRSGAIINSFNNDRNVYGMGWDNRCPDGPWLWVHNQEGNGMVAAKFDPIQGEYSGVAYDITEWNGIAGGAAVYERDGIIILLLLGQADTDLVMGMELCQIPDWAMTCDMEIIYPVVRCYNDFVTFRLTINNTGLNSWQDVWAEIYPTVGDCANGTQFDFNLDRRITTNLEPGQSYTNHFFYYINNVCGLGLSEAAVYIEAGGSSGHYVCGCCDEFWFASSWMSAGGEYDWGTEWKEYDDDITIPGVTLLGQNYPNPFNTSTTIPFELAEGGTVAIKVYNLTGRVVEVLVDRQMGAGQHAATWDASAAASGVYFYKLQTDDYSTVRKMNLVK